MHMSVKGFIQAPQRPQRRPRTHQRLVGWGLDVSPALFWYEGDWRADTIHDRFLGLETNRCTPVQGESGPKF